MKFKFIIILFSLVIASGYAQVVNNKDSVSEKKIEIQVIARVQKNKILLRWAVNDPLAWKKLNKYGYSLERYTVTRDNKTLEKPEKLILAKVIKPEPLETWEKLIEVNDEAAIVAQALYGEDFAITGADNLQSIINLSEDMQQRFTFALYTADKDYEIAKKAGLGFEDLNLNKTKNISIEYLQMCLKQK